MYNREDDLREKLNSALIRIFSLPNKDYVATLTDVQIMELKNALSEINNVITLRLSLKFSDWLSENFELLGEIGAKIRKSILDTKPNTNGFDIDISSPINVIAEVKGNIPLNGERKFGSNQQDRIVKDLKSLKYGKKKAPLRAGALRFLALFDSESVRMATSTLIKNLKPGLRNSVDLIEKIDIKKIEKDKIHVVFITL